MKQILNKIIVLDLDQTLFYCDLLTVVDNPDYVFTLQIKGGYYDGVKIDYAAWKRPHVDEFLKYIKENYIYGIYTANIREYALEHIEKLNLEPAFLLTEEDCVHYRTIDNRSIYLKRLNKLKGRYDLSKMIAIDDKHESYSQNEDNLISVSSFSGDTKDNQLLRLINFLEDLKDVEDIKSVEKRNWMNKY